jgi:energy-coupling factor transporter ATP-binding protein EcfA2
MLRGQPVLHASAVRRGEGVVAIGGATGSGKSTLAALLADGAPISDDLTLVRLGEARPAAILGGEAAARRWTAREAQRLASGAEVVLSDADVREMASGPSLGLVELWFLDAGGRGGEEIALERAAFEEGLLLLLLNGFGELSERGIWRRLFEVSRAMVERVPASRVRVPEALPALRAAVRGYREKVAS